MINYQVLWHLEKHLVVTGWNSGFSLLIGDIFIISTGTLFATIVTAEIGDGFNDVEIDDKLVGTWALGKNGVFFQL